MPLDGSRRLEGTRKADGGVELRHRFFGEADQLPGDLTGRQAERDVEFRVLSGSVLGRAGVGAAGRGGQRVEGQAFRFAFGDPAAVVEPVVEDLARSVHLTVKGHIFPFVDLRQTRHPVLDDMTAGR